jgi:hypothetical protein
MPTGKIFVDENESENITHIQERGDDSKPPTQSRAPSFYHRQS